jgi:hypothetical protein
MNWKGVYGPIVSLDFGAFPTVAISDFKLIKEALNDFAFSGRPDVPMFKDRSGGTRHGKITFPLTLFTLFIQTLRPRA